MRQLKSLNKYFWKYRFRLAIGMLFIFLSNYFNVLAPQITGFVVDYVQKISINTQQSYPANPANYDRLVSILTGWFNQYSANWLKVVALCGITILILALLRGFFLFLMRQTIIVMSRHIEYDQKNEVFNHYQQLDTSFYKTASTGDLMNRITEDISRVRMFTGPAIMYLVNLLTVITLSVFFMWKRSPELTIYVLLPLPILAVTIYFVNNTINKKSERIQETLSQLTANAQETYSGIRVIKSFVQEKAMLGFFKSNSEAYKKNAIGLAKVEAIYFPSITFLIGLSTLLTIMIGGLYYLNHKHQIGLDTIVEFVMYVNMLTFPVSAIGLTASLIQRASASQKRINEFLNIQPQISSPKDGKRPAIKGNISFQNVSFSYPHTGIQALKNFNLNINQGEKIAIIGKTGSGKSTLAQLLLRMYDVTEGKLIMDGHDIRSLNLKDLRVQISYVPQDVFLFSDSIQNNISFNTEAERSEVELAAERASVAGEIKRFANGYETAIGERGVMLSGGQKQRISIARALIKHPAIIILDDCLSAVDSRTENEITRNLETGLSGITAIIITHRILSSIHFDRIIVLEEGEIKEQGSHEQLLERGGYYAQTYARQQKREMESEGLNATDQ